MSTQSFSPTVFHFEYEPVWILWCLCLLSPLRFHDRHQGALFVCKAVLSFNKELGCVFPGPRWGAGRARKFVPKLPLGNHVFGTLNILPMSDFLGPKHFAFMFFWWEGLLCNYRFGAALGVVTTFCSLCFLWLFWFSSSHLRNSQGYLQCSENEE